jgi:hypothetical protein
MGTIEGFTKFCRFFQDTIVKNAKLLQINIKDSSELLVQEDENNLLKWFPRLAKQELTSYFTVMKEKGLVFEEPEALAIGFLMLAAGLNISLFLMAL